MEKDHIDRQTEEAVEKALQSMEQDVKRRAKLCAAEIEQAKAEERETCAQVCDEWAEYYKNLIKTSPSMMLPDIWARHKMCLRLARELRES